MTQLDYLLNIQLLTPVTWCPTKFSNFSPLYPIHSISPHGSHQTSLPPPYSPSNYFHTPLSTFLFTHLFLATGSSAVSPSSPPLLLRKVVCVE